MKNIRPAVGNHEHLSGGASPYYQYFGSRAGPSKKGYYSYNVGAWHAIVLNSEIVVNLGFADAERKAQLDWLDAGSQEQHAAVHGGLLAPSPVQLGLARLR